VTQPVLSAFYQSAAIEPLCGFRNRPRHSAQGKYREVKRAATVRHSQVSELCCMLETLLCPFKIRVRQSDPEDRPVGLLARAASVPAMGLTIERQWRANSVPLVLS